MKLKVNMNLALIILGISVLSGCKNYENKIILIEEENMETDNKYNIDFSHIDITEIEKEKESTIEETVEEHYDTKYGYLNSNSKLYSDNNLTYELLDLPKLEFLEVNNEDEISYLVKFNNKEGYIDKGSITLLEDTFVVVDISDQEMNLFENNEIVLTSPVVSGKPKTPSTKGIFEIFEISHNRYLVGPNYKSYVDVMMKYHNGEGLHDAEYHTDDNGKKHGWRDISEFGGETYLTDGSHGCINMPHDNAIELSNHVKIGTKVLVKE